MYPPRTSSRGLPASSTIAASWAGEGPIDDIGIGGPDLVATHRGPSLSTASTLTPRTSWIHTASCSKSRATLRTTPVRGRRPTRPGQKASVRAALDLTLCDLPYGFPGVCGPSGPERAQGRLRVAL